MQLIFNIKVNHDLKFFIYVFIVLCSNFSSSQIENNFEQKTEKYFNQKELNEIIWEGAKEIAIINNFPLSVLEENYQENIDDLFQAVKPFAEKRFRWIESTSNTNPQPNTKAFSQRKLLYKKELRKAVIEAIDDNKTLTTRLFYSNENDRIKNFHSEIIVNTNGQLKIVETIEIYNGKGGENDIIQRGIIREFPTKYKNKYGLISSVPFKIISVSKNGHKEPYKLERLDNGTRIYIGESHIYLNKGYFTYEIIYETAKQIIFHPEKNELYWNVNGNGWNLKTQKVSCTITLPEEVKIIENNCYTGYYNATESACKSLQIKNHVVSFSTIKNLNEYEGLTVSTTFQIGVIKTPTLFQNFIDLVKDNIILPILLSVVSLIFVINFIGWWRVGRDPKPGLIYPQFEPPKDFSPADCGYLMNQKYTPNLFASSIIDYAVHRLVDIEIKKEGRIFKTTAYYFNSPLPKFNQLKKDDKFYERYGYHIEDLYGEKAKNGEYNATIASKYNSLHNRLKDRMLIQINRGKKTFGFFAFNDEYTGIGLLFMFFSFFGTFIYFILFWATTVLIISSFFLLVIGVVLQILFMKWMSAYTIKGREKLDHILGFKMYLETTEQKVYNQMNPPEMTLQLFEKYLPYAIALGCENQWAKKFETILNESMAGGYQPVYFRSSGSSFKSSSLTNSMGSGLSSTISSASTPPSNSSGGSVGGGRSGGGGGGGGGGGW